MSTWCTLTWQLTIEEILCLSFPEVAQDATQHLKHLHLFPASSCVSVCRRLLAWDCGTLLNLQSAATQQLWGASRARGLNHAKPKCAKIYKHTHNYTHRQNMYRVKRPVCAVVQHPHVWGCQGVARATNCWLSHGWVSLPQEKYHPSKSQRRQSYYPSASVCVCVCVCARVFVCVQHWQRTVHVLLYDSHRPNQLFIYISELFIPITCNMLCSIFGKYYFSLWFIFSLFSAPIWAHQTSAVCRLNVLIPKLDSYSRCSWVFFAAIQKEHFLLSNAMSVTLERLCNYIRESGCWCVQISWLEHVSAHWKMI